MSFAKEVESDPAEKQNSEGWKRMEINEDPGADDSVDPSDGQQETQRRDDGDGEVSHVLPFVSKRLKGMKKC